MKSVEVATYTAETSMPRDTAAQVSDLFAFNYPASHSQADRESDIAAKINGDAILRILDSGKTIYVASTSEGNGPPVAGFIEASTRDMPDGTYEIMTWLMTAAEYRGRHVASLLHRTFILDATLRAIERSPKPTAALLNVSRNNPAKTIYEKWGYNVVQTAGDGKLIMTQSLPTNPEV